MSLESRPSAPPPIPHRWRPWLRVGVYLHAGITAFSALAVAGQVAAGGVHGNGEGTGVFFLGLLLVAAVLMAAPLSLLSTRRDALFLALRALGAIAMLAGFGTAFALFSFLTVEPAWQAWKFDRSLSPLRIASVQESPALFRGQPAGLRLVVELELPQAVRLDPQGMGALNLMRSLRVQLSKPEPGLGLASPWEPAGEARITLKGQALAELPGLARVLSSGNGNPGASLPAGLYRIERLLWSPLLEIGNGLPSDGTPDEPRCIHDGPNSARLDADLAQLQGRPLQVQMVASYLQTKRRGSHAYSIHAPLKVRYQHRDLRAQAQAQALGLPSCDAQEKQRQAQARIDRYQGGDNAQLFARLCAGDEAGVREMLALGEPKGSLWPQLIECTLDKPRPALFSLLMPKAYAQSQDKEGRDVYRYCGLLARLHNTGDLEVLSRLAELKLPLRCEGKDQEELWRNGFDPRMPSPREGPRKAARPLNESTELAWLQLMKAQGLPICKPAPDGSTLLQFAVKHRSAAVIEFLLDAGCDPHAPVPDRPVLDAGNSGLPAHAEMQPIMPVAGWTLRRFRSPSSTSTSPIEPERVAAITRRMGSLRAAEINRFGRRGQGSFLVSYRAEVLSSPALFHHLVQQGAKLDAVDSFGQSWFSSVHDDSMLGDPSDPPRQRPFAMLDSLSDAQMRELIRPGPAGLRQLADDYRTPSSFVTYLCKRKLGPCKPMDRS